MKKFLTKLLEILGVIIIINSLFMFAFSNFNLGNILAFLFGLLLIVLSYLFRKNKLPILRYILLFSYIIFFVFTGILYTYGKNDNIDYKEDAIIVLGAGIRGETPTLPLKYRLDKTYEYHKKNSECLIIVTGGKGFQENITEASAMEKYLIDKGIEKTNIIKEEKAKSTKENFIFSKEILDKKFDKNNYKTAFVTNDFHILRAELIAKKCGFKNITHIHGKTEWYTVFVNYLRETLALLKELIF